MEKEIEITGKLNPIITKYIDDKISVLATDLMQLKKDSFLVLTIGEQNEIMYYLRCIASNIEVDINQLPKWILELETIRRNYVTAEKLLWEWVTFTRITSVDEYPMELRKKTEKFLNKEERII